MFLRKFKRKKKKEEQQKLDIQKMFNQIQKNKNKELNKMRANEAVAARLSHHQKTEINESNIDNIGDDRFENDESTSNNENQKEQSNEITETQINKSDGIAEIQENESNNITEIKEQDKVEIQDCIGVEEVDNSEEKINLQ